MNLLEDVERLVAPALAEAGVDLVDLQHQRESGGWVLRFFLDKPGGFGLADCEEWSRRIGHLLDQTEFMSGRYSLEISSPGLDRPLRRPEHFRQFLGLEAIIRLRAPLPSGQRNFHGKLLSLEDQTLTLLDRTSGQVSFSLTEVAQARLDRQ